MSGHKDLVMISNGDLVDRTYEVAFDFAQRLLDYHNIARKEGFAGTSIYELSKHEPCEIVRELYGGDGWNGARLSQLIISYDRSIECGYTVNEENLNQFLDDKGVKHPLLREILKTALPKMCGGDIPDRLADSLEEVVGEGLKRETDYNLITLPVYEEKIQICEEPGSFDDDIVKRYEEMMKKTVERENYLGRTWTPEEEAALDLELAEMDSAAGGSVSIRDMYKYHMSNLEVLDDLVNDDK